jgi:hypothetical protein
VATSWRLPVRFSSSPSSSSYQCYYPYVFAYARTCLRHTFCPRPWCDATLNNLCASSEWLGVFVGPEQQRAAGPRAQPTCLHAGEAEGPAGRLHHQGGLRLVPLTLLLRYSPSLQGLHCSWHVQLTR